MGNNDDYFIFKLNPNNKSYSIRINTQQEFPADLIIPDKYNELPVTIIAKNAFLNCASLSTVFIPNTIEIIDNYAFSNCISLKRIDFENNSCLKSIGRYSFAKCTRLQSIVLQNKLENIFEYAFKGCLNLQHVYILSKRIKNICPSAFYNASKYLTIFMKRKYVSKKPLPSLCSKNIIHLPKVIPTDLSYFNFSLNEDKLSYGISAANQTDLPANLILPDSFNLLPITNILSGGFSCPWNNPPSIKMLILNRSLKTIGPYAFILQFLLEKLFIPKNVERIEEFSFGLSLITISGNPLYLHSDSILNSIIFEKGSKLTYLGNYAFWGNKQVTTIELPPNLTYIGDGAFTVLSLTELNIPQKVSYIGENITTMCSNLKRITIDSRNKNYKSIDNMLYSFDKSELLAIPLGSQNEIISIDKNVKKMAFPYAFWGNQSIKAVYSLPLIPPTSLNSNITSINLNSSKNRSIKIYVPDESIALYKKTVPWMSVADQIYPLSIITNENLAIENNKLIQCLSDNSTITLPDNITSIQDFAFEGCRNLENIQVNNDNQNFSSINGVLFNKYCSTLLCYPQNRPDTDYTIPKSVITIGHGAFMFAENLSKINIFKNLRTLLDYSFYYCTSLSVMNNLDFADNIETIGAYSFFYCHSIQSIKFHSLIKVGSASFAGCINSNSRDDQLCNNPIIINLGPKISIIDSNAFSHKNDDLVLIFEAAVPPKIADDYFTAKTILVPNNSLQAYKNAFPTKSDLIYPLESALIY